MYHHVFVPRPNAKARCYLGASKHQHQCHVFVGRDVPLTRNTDISSIPPTPPATATPLPMIALLTTHQTLEQLTSHSLPSEHILDLLRKVIPLRLLVPLLIKARWQLHRVFRIRVITRRRTVVLVVEELRGRVLSPSTAARAPVFLTVVLRSLLTVTPRSITGPGTPALVAFIVRTTSGFAIRTLARG